MKQYLKYINIVLRYVNIIFGWVLVLGFSIPYLTIAFNLSYKPYALTYRICSALFLMLIGIIFIPQSWRMICNRFHIELPEWKRTGVLLATLLLTVFVTYFIDQGNYDATHPEETKAREEAARNKAEQERLADEKRAAEIRMADLKRSEELKKQEEARKIQLAAQKAAEAEFNRLTNKSLAGEWVCPFVGDAKWADDPNCSEYLTFFGDGTYQSTIRFNLDEGCVGAPATLAGHYYIVGDEVRATIETLSGDGLTTATKTPDAIEVIYKVQKISRYSLEYNAFSVKRNKSYHTTSCTRN